MSKKCLTICAVLLSLILANFSYLKDNTEVDFSGSDINPKFDKYYNWFYITLSCDVPKPEYEVFRRALTGFFNLKAQNKIRNNVLTIIDFSLSSNRERMWIVDMNTMKVTYYSLVAHGRNSGDEYARHFSNKPSSNQSSLGFFLTDEIYYGNHGMSLYLDGVEPDVNDNARERAIVMHGANYVSKDFIDQNGRLGRSFGCPSIPMEDHEKVINTLSGGSCIYIHYPDENYFNNSQMFTPEKVLAGMYSLLGEAAIGFNFFPELLSNTGNY
jgi:hypothetical protein